MGDEIHVLDAFKNRKRFSFIEEGDYELVNETKPVYTNNLYLYPDDLDWLIDNNVQKFYVFDVSDPLDCFW